MGLRFPFHPGVDNVDKALLLSKWRNVLRDSAYQSWPLAAACRPLPGQLIRSNPDTNPAHSLTRLPCFLPFECTTLQFRLQKAMGSDASDASPSRIFAVRLGWLKGLEFFSGSLRFPRRWHPVGLRAQGWLWPWNGRVCPGEAWAGGGRLPPPWAPLFLPISWRASPLPPAPAPRHLHTVGQHTRPGE